MRFQRLPVACLLLAALLLAGCGGFAERDTLLFESYRDGEGEVYLIHTDGSDPVNLTEHAAYDGLPVWSPDGQRIAFTSERDGNADVYLMEADGSDPRRLTNGQGFSVMPEWSPDGSQILFVSNRTYRIEMEGGEVEVPGNTKVWLMDLAGGLPQRQTGALGADMFTSWSPAGDSFVFMSLRDGNPEIYLHGADGVDRNLTNAPGADDLNPAFAPDGRRIAFMTDRDGNAEIYVLDLEDGSLTNLTNHPANEGDPAWSPDGRRLAFTSDRDGNTEVYVMEADGTQQTRVTNHPARDIHPQWKPAGP